MKKINVIRSRTPSQQWRKWLEALSDAGFDVDVVEPQSMEYQASDKPRSGEAFLMDGMLPQISSYIENTCAQCPEMDIIVATETDSFTIKYEVMHLNGAIYVSGPLRPEQFVATICEIFLQNQVTAA